MRRFVVFGALVWIGLGSISVLSTARAGGVLLVHDSFSVVAVAVDAGITEIAPFDFFEISYTIDQSTADVNSSVGAGTFPALATAFSLSARPLNALPWHPTGTFDLAGSNYVTNAFGDNFTFQMRGSEFPNGGSELPFYDLELNWSWPDDVTDSGLDDQFAAQFGGGMFYPPRAVLRPSFIRFLAGPGDFRTVTLLPETPPFPGDYNVDDAVDAADYTVWRDSAPGPGLLANDATPGTISDDDYDVWKEHFGEAGAGGSRFTPFPSRVRV